MMEAAAAALVQLAAQPNHIEWDIVLQVLQLPESITQQQQFQHVLQLAADRLQEVLGDLEEVWWDQQSQPAELLKRLPFDCIVRLLSHPDTRVSSENTVVYTIERWFEAQRVLGQLEQPRLQQLQQLMALVHMRNCTSCYAGTVMQQSELVRRCFEVSELGLMREVCSPGGYERIEAARCPVLDRHPAWGAPQRPASNRQPVLEGAAIGCIAGGCAAAAERQ
jgi:hypothetical protein